MKMKRLRRPSGPSLRFSPLAWAKLLFLRDLGETEVGGFGIASDKDLLLIEDIQLVEQQCTGVSVVFDDESVADFFDRQVDAGRQPEQFARVWVHTHPGGCPAPSLTDEETFARVFGRSDWAVMFILAGGGQTYSRLSFHVGPGGSLELPVTMDYGRPFGAADHETWAKEYEANVRIEQSPFGLEMRDILEPGVWDGVEPVPEDEWLDHWYAYADDEPDEPNCGGVLHA
jgi:proteasome lid subunit RPN8/RPN11